MTSSVTSKRGLSKWRLDPNGNNQAKNLRKELVNGKKWMVASKVQRCIKESPLSLMSWTHLIGFGKRGLLEKGSFHKNPSSRNFVEILEKPQTLENTGASDHFFRDSRNLEVLSDGVRVRFRVRFQAVKIPIFGGFPVENPTKKANRLKALLKGISLSEYGSEGFRVRLRRLSEYASVV